MKRAESESKPISTEKKLSRAALIFLLTCSYISALSISIDRDQPTIHVTSIMEAFIDANGNQQLDIDEIPYQKDVFIDGIPYFPDEDGIVESTGTNTQNSIFVICNGRFIPALIRKSAISERVLPGRQPELYLSQTGVIPVPPDCN